ncbi:hypothetical protein HKD37_15G043459 [Glycine soja]
MGEVEEVQKQMKANMEAMKEQMAAMMEAMMSMKKIMEANAVAVAATSVVAKVKPMPPFDLNQINHSTSYMVADFEPCLGYVIEGQAVDGIPMPNTLEGPQFRPQPQPLHFAVGRAPPAMAKKGNKKPIEFTPVLVSYANLLHYLLDTAMVAITPARFPQPPFFRGYDSNAMCAYHGGAPGQSIEHCRALKHKVQGPIDAGWLKFEENHS